MTPVRPESEKIQPAYGFRLAIEKSLGMILMQARPFYSAALSLASSFFTAIPIFSIE